MSEILQLRGRVAVNEKLMVTLASGIDVDIDEMRTLCDKYEKKTCLRSDRIAVVAERLCASINQYKELADQTAAIKKDIGE
jgi:hypothetical protein